VLLSVLLVSCKSNDDKKFKSDDNIYKITKDMIKEDVDDLLGEPNEDIGFGMTIYAYQVNSATVFVGYDAEGKLVSATLQKSDGTEEELIKYNEK
jgi:hypothetical protein